MIPNKTMDTYTEREMEENLDNLEILDNQESVELRCVKNGDMTIYIDGKNNTYNSKSFLQKFEKKYYTNLKTNMSIETKKATKVFMETVVGVIFNEFVGKKVGEDFSIQDCVKLLMGNVEDGGNPPDVPKTSAKNENKVKKPRKKSGYNIFISENKGLLNEKIAEILKATGERKTPPSIAGPLWKALSDEEKKEYNDKAVALA